MQCPEFQDRCHELLDERSDPALDPLLRGHADHCPSCQQLLAGQRVLLSGLRHAALPPLPASFAQNVIRATAAPAPTLARRQPQLLLLAAGTLLVSAAAALLAVSLFWYARGSRPAIADQPATSPAVHKGHNQKRAPLRSAPGGSLALTQGNWLVEMPRLGNHVLEGIDDLKGAFPETVERLDEAARLSPGIRPLRLSIALLWDTFLRALPGVRDEQQPASPSRSSYWPAEFYSLA